MTETKIDHNELQKQMIDAYQRAVTNHMSSITEAPWLAAATDGAKRWIITDDMKRLIRQAIEQAYHAGHACASGHH